MKTIVPRQKRNFTCGIGAMAMAAQMLGLHFPKGTILSAIGAKPVVGTDHKTLVAWAEQHMPVASYGEKTYEGGLAVANIRNKDSGIGHYVVMLGKRGDMYRYYCPLLGEIFELPRAKIDWRNAAGNLNEWSVNFKAEHDFFDIDVEPERHVFIIGDPLDTLNHKFDTSLLIKAAYEAREQSVTWHTPDEVMTIGRKLFLGGTPVLDNDLVWFRCDPVNTVGYYELLRRLCHVDATIVNSPQSILLMHDKLGAQSFADTHQYTVSDLTGLRKAHGCLEVAGFSSFVLKAPSGFGGNGVVRAESYEGLEKHFHELLPQSGYVVVQGCFTGQGRPVDTRVLLTTEGIVGVIDRRAAEGAFLCNLHAGAEPVRNRGLTQEQSRITENVRSMMREEGVFLAGLDFIGDALIEVNVSCPSAVPQINALEGKHAEYDIIDHLAAFIACD